jgi:hypothetical protein
MPGAQPSLSTRARWIIRTQLAAASPGRKQAPASTPALPGSPFTSPARDAVCVAFRKARRDGQRRLGHLLPGLTAWDGMTAALARQRPGIS